VTEPVKKKSAPIGLIVWCIAAVAIIAGLSWAVATGKLTWAMAVDAKEAAAGFVAGAPVIAYAVYVSLFVVLALALFPAQLWIIMFGAVLFGFWPALIVSWMATVASAIIVFLAASNFLAKLYRERTRKHLERVEEAFLKDQFAWMLAVRFIPVVPYFVSNIAPALLGGRLAPFSLAAAIGVIPYVSAYTFAGAKAAAVLDRDKPPDVASLAADMLPIMLAIAVLPLASIAVKRFMKSKQTQ
jgi:uncharacterized membrane protein YdjX (TVP38/TMEM64 family)